MQFKSLLILFLIFVINDYAIAQSGYWQQHVSYDMQTDFDVESHRFKGVQNLTYTNNSPDTLSRVYYHLYFNAFQPGSMMDARSRTIPDPDKRIGERISKLKENQQGFHKIDELKQDGKDVKFKVEGTILVVDLSKPILPGSSSEFSMKFNSQVPVQIRRSGRNNREGVAYSMSQWYPKMVEYDVNGWNANPYIGREYHGVWGDFDVKITIDKDYTIGGTGYLQNESEIGHGYGGVEKKLGSKKLTWHFKAPNVHDFVWAADKDYLHKTAKVPNGPDLHFLYKDNEKFNSNWDSLVDYTIRCFQIMSDIVGPYPYDQYSVIQAGDGGMEYPMATLISGHGSKGALISVTVHEGIHSWFQGLLATNESLYAWMDEGFTSYYQRKVLDSLYGTKKLNPYDRSYKAYFALHKAGKAEALTTHADHFNTNRAYGAAAYSTGTIFLHQLSYIIGDKAFNSCIKKYFETWKYKHPTPTDFKRIAEKVSGIELDWYFEYWINTTHTIDYGITTVFSDSKETKITLDRIGIMPMPIDLLILYEDGSKERRNIPLLIMRNHKNEANMIYMESWPWTFPTYTFAIPSDKKVKRIIIDPKQKMADIDRTNNQYPSKRNVVFEAK